MGDTLGSVAVMISAGLLWYYDNDTENNTWLLYIDPALTFLIATIIAISTYPLFITTITILMEHAPEDINLEEFQKKIEKKVEEIGFKDCKVNLKNRKELDELKRTVSGHTLTSSGKDFADKDSNNNNQSQNNRSSNSSAKESTSSMLIHDLHIWQLSSTKRAATIHVIISRCKSEDDSALIKKYLQIIEFLKKEFSKNGVDKVTIQPEFVTLPDEVEMLCSSENCGNCGVEGDCETTVTSPNNKNSKTQTQSTNPNITTSNQVDNDGFIAVNIEVGKQANSPAKNSANSAKNNKNIKSQSVTITKVVDIEDLAKLGSVRRQHHSSSGKGKIDSATKGISVQHYP